MQATGQYEVARAFLDLVKLGLACLVEAWFLGSLTRLAQNAELYDPRDTSYQTARLFVMAREASKIEDLKLSAMEFHRGNSTYAPVNQCSITVR